MSKKKPEKRDAESSPKMMRKISTFLHNERTRFIAGMCILMFAVFLFLSFISFFFTGDADQSSLENLPISQLTDVKNNLQNWTGFIGAYLAELLINRWVGISSFLICLFLAAAGLKMMKIKDFRLTPIFLYCNILLLWGSLFFGFFFINGYEDSFIYLGGAHGYYMSLLLKANIGTFGTFLIITLSFLIILTVASPKTIDYIRQVLHINIPSFSQFRFPRKKHQAVEEFEDDRSTQELTATIPVPEPVYKPAPAEEMFSERFEEEEKPFEEVILPKSKVEKDPLDDLGYVLSKPGEVEHENPHWISKDARERIVPPTPLAETPFESEFIPVIPEEKPQPKEEKGAEFVVNAGGKPEDEELVEAVVLEDYDPTLDLSRYKTPSFDLLNKYEGGEKEVDMEEQNANKKRIEDTLRNYGIEIQAITATVGPTITLYEIIPKQGVRIAKIRSLEDDIALSLAALGIRIIAPIPGKGTVGIEVPNKDPQMVPMHSIIASRKFQESKYELPVALGKTITNEIFMIDLAKMPHVLVAGATGQGKSVGLNAIITSLLYKKHPAQLKLVLIDPKKVEFNIYSKIERHFLAKLPDSEEAIITDVTKVVATLNSICKEMDDRYDLLKMASTRNIKEYNVKFQSRQLNPEKGHRYMPYIVVIVDEFGDLIMTAGKEVELPIARIAQLARAVGIHMIIATQRPSTNIITGIIKANFPARIAFRVSSMIDSRTILDTPGANQLIGRGDMLFSQGGDLVRVQCAFVDTPEVEQVSEYIGNQQGYPTAFLLPEYVVEGSDAASDVDLRDRDQMFEEAARLVVANQQGSTSMIQRKFSIGYNRAGRIMDQLEAAGIVGPFEGSKARQVLVMDDMHLDQVLEQLR
ncbi:MAG: DNA translocase FtsK [Bacteroidales bacterium]